METEERSRVQSQGKPKAIVLLNIFLILIILFACLMILGPFLGFRSEVVLSGSMEPAIPAGGVVFVRPIEPAEIREGNIIMYTSRDGTNLVTHRVVRVESDAASGLRFVTRGDANRDPDPNPIPARQVVGTIWFHLPFIGILLLFIRTPLGLGLTIGAPLLVILASELHHRWFGGDA